VDDIRELRVIEMSALTAMDGNGAIGDAFTIVAFLL
jgi:hypothetical protein